MTFWQSFGIACIPLAITIIGAVIAYQFSIREFKNKEVYRVKEQAIIKSLNYIDDYISWLNIVENHDKQQRKSINNPEFTIAGREIFNELCVTCKNSRLILLFSEIILEAESDIFSKFSCYRNLARKELGLKHIQFSKDYVYFSCISTKDLSQACSKIEKD